MMIEQKDLENLRIKLFAAERDPQPVVKRKTGSKKSRRTKMLVIGVLFIAFAFCFFMVSFGKLPLPDQAVNPDYIKNYKVLNSFTVPEEADRFFEN